jgi:hypothetical protein
MAIFNQQGQSVGYQFNGETFHFDSARSIPVALSELEKLLWLMGPSRCWAFFRTGLGRTPQ